MRAAATTLGDRLAQVLTYRYLVLIPLVCFNFHVGHMERQSPYLTDNDFAELDFKDRFSLAFELTKSYGLRLFAVLFIVGILITGYAVFLLNMLGTGTIAMPVDGGQFNGDPSSILFGVLLLFILGFFIIPFLGVGIKFLALHYVMGEEPESVVATILAPANRLGFFLICFFLWFATYIGFVIFSAVIEMVPWLGKLISFLLALFYYLVNNCASSYMADRGLYKGDMTDPVKAVSDPFRFVYGRFKAWSGALLVVLMIFFLPGVLVGFGYGMVEGDNYFGLGLMAVGGLLMIFVAVFDIFMMIITYKHTSFTGGRLSDLFE